MLYDNDTTPTSGTPVSGGGDPTQTTSPSESAPQQPSPPQEHSGSVHWEGSTYSGPSGRDDYAAPRPPRTGWTGGPSAPQGSQGPHNQNAQNLFNDRRSAHSGFNSQSAQGQSWQPNAGQGWNAGPNPGSQHSAGANSGGWQSGAGGSGGGTTPPPERPTGTIPSGRPPRPQRKRGGGVGRMIAAVLVCALVGGSAGMGGAALYNGMSGGSTTLHYNGTQGTTVNVSQSDGVTPMSLTEIYAAYANSCVCINATVPVSTGYWGGYSTQYATSSGSGFIISEDGYIVTNYHVIADASEITVSLYSGDSLPARVVGTEETSDIAVLKVDAEGLTPVVIGDSDQLQVGETVCTIGNALGTLSFSQTSGGVSALNRTVTMEDGTVANMIQTDCAINSGNSGGPLFDSYGRVVGITSAKLSNNGDTSSASIENIGFAIPMNDVYDMITDIIEYGYITGKPSMGITVATVTEEYASYFNWPVGAIVNSVEVGSCAEAAGLKQGDIITKMGDTDITTHGELVAAKNTYKAGETTTLTVFRSGETLTLTITFDEDTSASTASQSSASGGSSSFGGNSFGGPSFGGDSST